MTDRDEMRKNRLLKEALDCLYECRPNPEDFDFGPAYGMAVSNREKMIKQIEQELKNEI